MSGFSQDFQNDLLDLMRWRRDVRRFRRDPVDEALLQECLATFQLAHRLGDLEHRFLGDAARAAALANFKTANQRALDGYSGEKASLYSGLKLSGMQEAPVQLAIYCDDSTTKGAGLGAGTMPETRRYSVVGAITHFWLAARARGLGVGWVSILDPANDTPELELAGWETRHTDLIIETR